MPRGFSLTAGLYSAVAALKSLFGLSQTTETPASGEFHPSCLVGDGSTVYMESSSAVDFTIGNSGWTIMYWFMPFTNLSAATEGIVELRATGGDNGPSLLHVDDAGTEKVRARIYSQGSGTSDHDVDGIATSIYNQVVVSRGTNDKVYVNGYLGYNAAAAGTLTAVNRKLTIGAQQGGSNFSTARIHSVAIWNTELSADEVASIFANGCGYAAQLDKDFDSYTSSSNLIHWYRLGLDITTPGKDHVGSNDVTGGVFADTDFVLNGPGSGALYLTTTPEYLANTTTQDVGFGNAWSFILNFRSITAGASRHFFTIGPATNENTVLLKQASAGNVFEIDVYNSSGTLFKQYTFGDMSRTQERRWIGATWDGTNLNVYENGYALTPTKTTDDSDSQTQTDRAIHINTDASAANGGDHTYRSLAFWSTALSAAEMEALWYDGGYDVVDLRNDFNSYGSSASLVHWWVMNPALSTEQGTDYVTDKVASGGIDLSANDSGVTGLDDHYSWPLGGLNGTTALAPGASLDFDGTNSLSMSAETGLGIVNAFTVSAWCQTDVLANAHTLIDIIPDSGANEEIKLQLAGNTAGDPIRVDINNSSGTLTKRYHFSENITDSGKWMLVTITWDGSSLLCYMNGDEDTGPSKVTDNALTLSGTDRNISIGNNLGGATQWDGRIGPVTIWNSALTADEIRYAYRMGYHFNPLADNGDYASSGDLVAAYRLGAKDYGDLGHDYSANGFDLSTETSIAGTERRGYGPAAGEASGN